MFETTFTPPDPQTAVAETNRRQRLIAAFTDEIRPAVKALAVCGSVAYGNGFSVKPSSDIDIQLFISHTTVQTITKLGIFENTALQKALSGYMQDAFQQFSLNLVRDN